MKTNKFVKWEIQKILPMFFVLLLVSTAIVWLLGINSKMYYNTGFYYNSYDTRIILVGVLGVIASFCFPFFVYDYRFEKLAASAYRQAPERKNQMRNIRILIGLVAVVILFSFVYLLNFVVIVVKYNNTLPSFVVNGREVTRYGINFNYFLYGFLIGLLTCVLTYFANCFFVSMGNCLSSCVIFAIAGNLILLFGTFVIPCWIIESMNLDHFFIGGLKWDAFNFMGGLVKDFEMITYIQAKSGASSPEFTNQNLPIYLVSVVTRLAIIPACFITREPSGEFYHSHGGNRLWKRIILYISYAMLIGILACIIIDDFFELIFLAIYLLLLFAYFYLNTSIFNKRFVPNKEDGIMYGAMFLLFVLTIVGAIVFRSIYFTTIQV